MQKNYEKHRGGASRQGARSPQERCLACLTLSLASANIVTFLLLFCFFTMQRYGYFRILTIASLWHFVYQDYGMNTKIADRTDCLSATYVKQGYAVISFLSWCTPYIRLLFSLFRNRLLAFRRHNLHVSSHPCSSLSFPQRQR